MKLTFHLEYKNSYQRISENISDEFYVKILQEVGKVTAPIGHKFKNIENMVHLIPNRKFKVISTHLPECKNHWMVESLESKRPKKTFLIPDSNMANQILKEKEGITHKPAYSNLVAQKAKYPRPVILYGVLSEIMSEYLSRNFFDKFGHQFLDQNLESHKYLLSNLSPENIETLKATHFSPIVIYLKSSLHLNSVFYETNNSASIVYRRFESHHSSILRNHRHLIQDIVDLDLLETKRLEKLARKVISVVEERATDVILVPEIFQQTVPEISSKCPAIDPSDPHISNSRN